MTYEEFLQRKQIVDAPHGFSVTVEKLNPAMFEWQAHIDRWLLKKGRAAAFEDCGLGKTLQQLEWANRVNEHTGENVLILAPLSVSEQTVREGQKFQIPVTHCWAQDDVKPGINITNYERLDKFDASKFAGIVLDESSILKSFTGATKQAIIDTFHDTPYRLACTATPAPNDFMELGNHAEFLGVMKRNEMLASFFIHDGGSTSQWRLKGHAEDAFWAWVSSWAVVLSNPADLGYPQNGYDLPVLNIVEHIVGGPDAPMAKTLTERREARKSSLTERVAKCAEIANGTDDPVLCWCDYNEESKRLSNAVHGAVEVTGSDKHDVKSQRMSGFSSGEHRVLVSKPKIAGFGMNWQHCNTVIFCGLSDSFEAYYQAVRRCWRFGQTRPVTVHIVTSAAEKAVVENIKRKQDDARKMTLAMAKYTREIVKENISETRRVYDKYQPEESMKFPNWIGGTAA